MSDFTVRWWNNPWALTFTAGILLGISFPPFPFPFPLLLPIGFMFFYRLIDITGRMRATAYYGYFGILLWNIITTYWLCMADITAGVAAILANSVVMTLPLMGMKFVNDRIRNTWLLVALQASFWITFEFLHFRWDLAWPWLTLGNAFSTEPVLIQYISITGILGASFWLVALSGLLYNFFKKRQRSIGYAIGVFFTFPVLLSVLLYTMAPLHSAHKVQVEVVQPNYDSYLELSGYRNPYKPLNKIIAYSDSVRSDSTALVLWPENAIQIGISMDSPITQRLRKISMKWGTTIISGTNYYQYYTGKHHPYLVRHDGNGDAYNIFNAALAFEPNGKIKVYRKRELVPIVERVPFVNFMGRLHLFGVDWSDLQGYGRGDKVTLLPVDNDSTMASICYDADFPDWTRRFIKKGASFISMITNDGWWGKSSGYIQHFEYARLRAIENRRYVVRSANNGISAVIAPNGNVLKRTQYWTREAFLATIPEMHTLTLYTRYGDVIGYLALIAVTITVIILVTLKRDEQTEENG